MDRLISRHFGLLLTTMVAVAVLEACSATTAEPTVAPSATTESGVTRANGAMHFPVRIGNQTRVVALPAAQSSVSQSGALALAGAKYSIPSQFGWPAGSTYSGWTPTSNAGQLQTTVTSGGSEYYVTRTNVPGSGDYMDHTFQYDSATQSYGLQSVVTTQSNGWTSSVQMGPDGYPVSGTIHDSNGNLVQNLTFDRNGNIASATPASPVTTNTGSGGGSATSATASTPATPTSSSCSALALDGEACGDTSSAASSSNDSADASSTGSSPGSEDAQLSQADSADISNPGITGGGSDFDSDFSDTAGSNGSENSVADTGSSSQDSDYDNVNYDNGGNSLLLIQRVKGVFPAAARKR